MKLSRGLLSIAALCVCVFALSGVGRAQQSPRGITPEDYFSFEFISDPQISPDGKLIAYVLTKVDRAQNRRNSSIWMVATDASRAPCQVSLRNPLQGGIIAAEQLFSRPKARPAATRG